MTGFGWYEGTFVPYDNDIEVTGEENFDRVYKSIHEEGNFKVWLDEMYAIRKNVALRLVMAASFGSIMNEKLGKNGFVTHVWGTTGCGKTVALQVATSIWANPSNGHYITKMNNTANFISRLAAFLYNMPTILDELETFSGKSEDLNDLIMNLTEGIDRGKAKKEGGVQDLKTWHNSFIFSGEHSISTDNLGGGTYNRLIEIYCKDKIIEDGVRTSAIVKENYGFAGKIFVEYIKNTPKEDLLRYYNQIYQDLLNNKNTEEKQAQNMAILMLADKIAVNTIFLGEKELTAEQVSEFMFSKEEIDVSERAWNFIQNELAINISKFMIGDKLNMGYECWGKVINKKQEGWSYVCINKNALKSLLEKNGFSYNKTINDWDEKKYILRDERSKRRDVNTSLNGKKQWVFRLNLKLLEGGD